MTATTIEQTETQANWKPDILVKGETPLQLALPAQGRFEVVEKLSVWTSCADSRWLGAIHLVLPNSQPGYDADLSLGLGRSHLPT